MAIKLIGSGLLGSALKKELEKDFEIFQYTRKDFTVEETLNHNENPAFFFNYNDLVINAVGAIPQKPHHYIQFNQINNLFPKYISKLCKEAGARMIHFSTSDVFSGRLGNYTEKDYPDPTSVYGHSKSLGESIKTNSMVIRCSFVGVEKDTNYSLMSWFLKENKPVYGWANSYFNGLHVATLSKCIRNLINKNLFSPGLFHLYSPNILSKYDLLKTINEVYSAKKDLKLSLNKETINRTLLTGNKWFIENFDIPPIQQQIIENWVE